MVPRRLKTQALCRTARNYINIIAGVCARFITVRRRDDYRTLYVYGAVNCVSIALAGRFIYLLYPRCDKRGLTVALTFRGFGDCASPFCDYNNNTEYRERRRTRGNEDRLLSGIHQEPKLV